MALWKLLRPILNVTGATKKLQKLFEKVVAENQAAGLSANSAYNAAKREVMETLKKIKVTKKAEGGEIKTTWKIGDVITKKDGSKAKVTQVDENGKILAVEEIIK